MDKLEANITQRRGQELPHFVNNNACSSIIRDVVAHFEHSAEECVDKIDQLLDQTILEFSSEDISGNTPSFVLRKLS